MYLVQVGRLTISLNHLILAEGTPEPVEEVEEKDVLRMTLETGRVIELRGREASLGRHFVDDVSIKRPVQRSAIVGREITTGDVPPSSPTPLPQGEREEGCIAVGNHLGNNNETEARGAGGTRLA